jgi:hypothetical protein
VVEKVLPRFEANADGDEEDEEDIALLEETVKLLEEVKDAMEVVLASTVIVCTGLVPKVLVACRLVKDEKVVDEDGAESLLGRAEEVVDKDLMVDAEVTGEKESEGEAVLLADCVVQALDVLELVADADESAVTEKVATEAVAPADRDNV